LFEKEKQEKYDDWCVKMETIPFFKKLMKFWSMVSKNHPRMLKKR